MNNYIKYFIKGIFWTILFIIIYMIGLLLLVPFLGFYSIVLMWFPLLLLEVISPFSIGINLIISIILILAIGGFIYTFFKKIKGVKK